METTFSSVFFFPNPNKLRFLDLDSSFAVSVPFLLSVGSCIVGVESPVSLWFFSADAGMELLSWPPCMEAGAARLMLGGFELSVMTKW